MDLVKKHPPDRDPEGFKAIHEAYEKLKDLPLRLEALLFDKEPVPDGSHFLLELKASSPRRPIPLLEIIRTCRKK